MIRKAVVADIKTVQVLINRDARRYRIIPRSLNDLYESIRDIFIYEVRGKIRGVCALHVVWEDLAEIRSLIVDKRHRGKGIGRSLIHEALAEAHALGVKRVFSLTYVPEYFHVLGFEDIDKSSLPHKIWSDCLSCPQFPDCDELAVIKNL